MIGQELLRFPYDVDGHIDFLEYIKDGDIGHVAMSGGGQTPVERDFEAFCSTVLGEKHFRGLARSHCMGGGWPGADPVQFPD